MSTIINEKQLTEELAKESILSNGAGVTLSPKKHYYLHGTPGKRYVIQATNFSDELNATVYAYDNKNGWLFNNLKLEPFGSVGEMFQMGSEGRVTVYNWSSTEYDPNPEVNFRLKAK